MKYLMRFDTHTAELAWEYPFKADSDKMALDYASKHAMWVKHNLVVFKQKAVHEYVLLGRIMVSVNVTAQIIAEGLG